MFVRSRATEFAVVVALLTGCTAAGPTDRTREVGVVTSAIRCQSEFDCLIQGAGSRCVPNIDGQLECIECLNDLDCVTVGRPGSICHDEICIDSNTPTCDSGSLGEGCTVQQGNCSTGGELACDGTFLYCRPTCWYLCVKGSEDAIRTQYPCDLNGQEDTACVPEDPNCF